MRRTPQKLKERSQRRLHIRFSGTVHAAGSFCGLSGLLMVIRKMTAVPILERRETDFCVVLTCDCSFPLCLTEFPMACLQLWKIRGFSFPLWTPLWHHRNYINSRVKQTKEFFISPSFNKAPFSVTLQPFDLCPNSTGHSKAEVG